MLSLFPQLLFLSPLAITLLRLAAGSGFAIAAWRHMQPSQTHSVMIFGAIEFFTAVLLLGGVYTQGVALLAAGLLVLGKLGVAPRSPLSHDAQWFLAILCISLVFMGAGAFAFDLPL